MSLLVAAALATSPAVDAHLRNILRDYDSARIEPILEPRPIEWKVRCGLLQRGCKSETFDATMHCYRINGKNAYGGYTGWVYYWFLERDGVIVYDGDDRYSLHKYCGFDPGPSQN